MRTLVIETATQACSVALFDEGRLVGGDLRVLGRGHAEALVPMIAALPDKGRAERILVSLGPGSFTGIRVGLAAARALALAWQADCVGYPTLGLVAASNQHWGHPPGPREGAMPDVLVCMEGGHGEWFLQTYNEARTATSSCRSASPDQAASEYRNPVVVGSRAAAFVERRGWGEAHEVFPDAAQAMQIDLYTLTSNLTPIYGRAPDARLPAGSA